MKLFGFSLGTVLLCLGFFYLGTRFPAAFKAVPVVGSL